MQATRLALASAATLVILVVGCGSTMAAPVRAVVPTNQGQTSPVAVANPSATALPQQTASPGTTGYKSQVVSGNSVTVEFRPVELEAGKPSEFEIAMNTHSVDLSADMLQSVILRDDTGKEYAPTKWDGPSSGGHHRSGKIEFGDLGSDAKSVTLFVRGIAQIPERVYKWDVQ